uniref:Uncharacterized protein n=1 Tax=Arundo donax TaxID=35708 RepID=A0A0A9FRP9_ARUDO
MNRSTASNQMQLHTLKGCNFTAYPCRNLQGWNRCTSKATRYE